MSNKYFRDWQASNSSGTSGTTGTSKSDTSHLKILKKLDADNARLDTALDKIKTEEKAAKIFNQSQYTYSSKSTTNQFQVYTQLGFVNLGSPYPQPVHLTHVGDKFVVVNGCVVMRPNGFF